MAGNGGSAGMGGTLGRLSLAALVMVGKLLVEGGPTGFELPAAGAIPVSGGCVTGNVAGGHAAAPVSVASDAPLVAVSGGTPSGD